MQRVRGRLSLRLRRSTGGGPRAARRGSSRSRREGWIGKLPQQLVQVEIELRGAALELTALDATAALRGRTYGAGHPSSAVKRRQIAEVSLQNQESGSCVDYAPLVAYIGKLILNTPPLRVSAGRPSWMPNLRLPSTKQRG